MSDPHAEEELTEDDRLDMATDLAFDLDEFFRQRDPQYAAEHPDEHSGKEQIANMLMDGKTRALKEQLAAMAQGPEDALPVRIAEYEAATRYEEYLDIDTAAIRESTDTFSIYCIFRLHPATCTVFFCHLAEQNPPPCRGCLPLHRWCKGSARSLRSGKALASKVQLVNQSS